ncbi:MAG: hypothetical protein K2K52_05475 [Paramuribaculum sp.]|nr:hypothetical protein [Paramuribaculum sp.]
MIPQSEHALYGWLIIIGAVCIATIIGALIDRVFLNRKIGNLKGFRPYYIPQIVKEISTKDSKIKK